VATLAACQQLFVRCYPSGNWAERSARLLAPLHTLQPLYNFVGAAELLRSAGHADAVVKFIVDLDEDERALVKGGKPAPAELAASAPASGSQSKRKSRR
jgi:hypothetical protein